MKFLTLFAVGAVALTLAACNSTTNEPKQSPTPKQQAELEQARAEMIKAECNLYKGAIKKDPKVTLPEQCIGL